VSWRTRSPKTLAHRYSLNGHADDVIRGQHGTLVNSPTWAQTPWGPQCIELDGDDAHVNVGDIVALNAVSAFTIAFWMNQDVLDQTDVICRKYAAANRDVTLMMVAAGGLMRARVRNNDNTYGQFDYSTAISAGHWHHVAVVFDGSQADNVNRLVIYVDGATITLAFVGTIPAVTYDLSGVDATIGKGTDSFDGKLFDFRIYSCSLSRDEINVLMRRL